jgi:hypothetical protein
MTWKDVSSTYAGVFFRVMGGKAASFGEVQEDDAPRLIEVTTGFNDHLHLEKGGYGQYIEYGYNITIPKEGWSDWTITGHYTKDDAITRLTRFQTSGKEVRPRNMAIRVWKRAE